MKRLSVVIIVGLAAMCCGCNNPLKLRWSPENRVEFVKTPLGVAMNIASGSDTDARLTNLVMKRDPKSGDLMELTIGQIVFVGAPSKNEGLTKTVYEGFNRGMELRNEGDRINWAGANQALQTVASVAGPAMGAFFQTKQMGIQASPQMTMQAALEIFGKYLDGSANPAVIQPILKQQAPELAQKVEELQQASP